MLSFTDTELQKKFCEGFSFFPFKSLEQHGTLIYKSYAGKGNLRKVLEWNDREHDCSHYAVKLSRKLKYTDTPAAVALLDMMDAARDWWNQHLPPAHPLSKELPGGVEKYYNMLRHYEHKIINPLIQRLSEKYEAVNIENMVQMEGVIQQFLQNTDALDTFLRSCSSKKRGFGPRMLEDSDREYLFSISESVADFRALQERNLNLLNAWKTQLLLQTARRSMN